MKPVSTALMVPTFEGQGHLIEFFDKLFRQTTAPDHLIFIDSSTTEHTEAILRAHGVSVHKIKQSEFDHGATRNMGLSIATDLGVELVVFMSQDAKLASDTAFETLVNVFRDPSVAAAFGRQLPRPDAGLCETVGRAARYPPIDSEAERSHLGPYFFSNAFGAYRRAPLVEIGGFYEPVLFGEDARASHALQEAGYRVVYEPRATAVHSHAGGLKIEVRRAFDVGATTVMGAPPNWATETSGVALVRRELQLARKMYGIRGYLAMSLSAIARTCGFVLGRNVTRLPKSVRDRLSYSPKVLQKVLAGGRL